MDLVEENNLAHQLIGFAIEVHKSIGPGLSKLVYFQCLEYELNKHHIPYESSIRLPVHYKNIVVPNSYEIDFIIESKVILLIETAGINSDCQAQKLLRILKLKNYTLGLLINFNNTLLKDGIRRVTNSKSCGQITETKN